MKTIAYQDRAGGCLHGYFSKDNPRQTRWQRFFKALKDLEHTGNIIIYRINGKKAKKLKVKGY